MRIGLSKFLDSLSIALDFVEKEILNVAPYHGQRVASITNRLAKAFNLEENVIFALTHAALLHDCALNEYFHDETPNNEERAQENKELKGMVKDLTKTNSSLMKSVERMSREL
ncbi:MAG: hypothetical protein II567_01545, partial [Candidatus Riflebacteria bacterium]|nr:hypothetical protein [Candidatus Riflebacteria bacterium]